MLNVKAVGVSLLLLFFGCVGRPAAADSAHGSCASALDSVTQTWNGIGFAAPSKPGQGVVNGKSGHVTTGGQFGYIVGQIREARLECARGEVEESLRRSAVVTNLLAATARSNG